MNKWVLGLAILGLFLLSCLNTNTTAPENNNSDTILHSNSDTALYFAREIHNSTEIHSSNELHNGREIHNSVEVKPRTVLEFCQLFINRILACCQMERYADNLLCATLEDPNIVSQCVEQFQGLPIPTALPTCDEIFPDSIPRP